MMHRNLSYFTSRLLTYFFKDDYVSAPSKKNIGKANYIYNIYAIVLIFNFSFVAKHLT